MSGTYRGLRALLAPWVEVPAGQDRPILGLTEDSRRVQPGYLFLAAPGARHDGRAYIRDALQRGAAAVVCEPDAAGVSGRKDMPAPVFDLPALRRQIGLIADRFYGSPSRRVAVIGVTGTNGKTTCTQLLAQALDTGGARCGLIGTLGAGFPGHLRASDYTTPDAVEIQQLLAEFADAGAAYAAMEVSSHALDQGRVTGVAFRGAVFTNLTRDHLDYHGDMAAYGAAKARLFAVPGLDFGVINADDIFGRALLEQLAGTLHTRSFGFDQGDVRAELVRARPDGLELKVATAAGRVQFTSGLLGRFNAANLLAVLASLLALGMDLDEAALRLSRVQPVTGRMQRFGGRGAPLVVVDYAHTPDALEKALAALREHTAGRLWCVFGCGGDRDRGKRPLMGKLAQQLADCVVVTSDNPRHEPPAGIIADILAGMADVADMPAPPEGVRVIPDREQAVRAAVDAARPGDVVLVAGKGHEDYQQVGDRRLPFSDVALVRRLVGEAA